MMFCNKANPRCILLPLLLLLQRGGDPVEVFGLLAPAAAEEAASEHSCGDEQQQQTENEAPSPASSVRSAVSLASSVADSAAAGGKRSRIPTLSRAGLADRTNVG
jgi:hypothetical protein